MPNEAHFLDITLLGKEYCVACPPDQRAALLTAASYVDGKMREIAEKRGTMSVSASLSWQRSILPTSTLVSIRSRQSSIRKLNLK
jgi:hypothetical protein